MELVNYFNILRRWAWLIVLGAGVAGGIAFLVSRTQTPIYQATSTSLVSLGANSDGYDNVFSTQRVTESYAQRMKNYDVLETTIAQLDLPITVGALNGAVSVSSVQSSNLIRVRVEHPDPVVASQIANTLPEVFAARDKAQQQARFTEAKESLVEQIAQLEGEIIIAEDDLQNAVNQADSSAIQFATDNLLGLRTTYSNLLRDYESIRLAEANSIDTLLIDEYARPSQSPIRPNVLSDTMLAAVVGAMLAIGVIFLIEYLDNTIKTTIDVERLLNLPVIGYVSVVPSNDEGNIPYSAKQPRSQIAESFRGLRTNLEFSGVDEPLKTVLVTSCGPEEGKTTIATNLAVVLAQSSKRVVLVDCDLRRPRVHKAFSVPNDLGLSDFFRSNVNEIEGIIQDAGVPNLDLITSGNLPPNPAELLGSAKMKKLLEDLRIVYDFVVIDTPPFAVSDAPVLGSQVDGVVFVVRPNQTESDVAVAMLEQFQRVGAHVVGVVFNQLSRSSSYGGYQHYYASPYYLHDDSLVSNGSDSAKKGRGIKQALKIF